MTLMADRKYYSMYIVGKNDAGFQWGCPAYSLEQAKGYATQQFGYKILIRDAREI